MSAEKGSMRRIGRVLMADFDKFDAILGFFIVSLFCLFVIIKVSLVILICLGVASMFSGWPWPQIHLF